MSALYRVLLVEKQQQMIHVYKNMIPWEESGFQIASVADSESDALALYGEYKYDVIFTALDLQGGNGVSLIKKLRHLGPECIVAVISAHEDYDSVREAFVVGAYDYLLKSRLRYSTLTALLDRIREDLAKKEATSLQESWEEMLEKILGLIRDEQKVDYDLLKEILNRPELYLLQGRYRLLYFRQDNIRNFNRSLKRYDKPFWMNSDEFIDMFRNKVSMRDEIQLQLKRLITQYLQGIRGACILFNKKHSGVIVLPPLPRERYEALAHQIIDAIGERLTYDFSVTVSTEQQGIDDFLGGYQQVMEYHMSHKFYDGDRCVEFAEDAREIQRLQYSSFPCGNEIAQGIMEQNFDKVKDSYAKAIGQMIERFIDFADVKGYFVSILHDTKQVIYEHGISEQYPFDILYEGINEAESIQFLQLELEKIFKTLIDWVREHHISRYHHKVTAMLDYIDEHIAEKLTLEMVASASGLSVTHASRLFKSEVGHSVIEYVNERKMAKAEELMHDRTRKIKDVAAMVGISDQLYFNKVFKKYYHLSPREYRKRI